MNQPLPTPEHLIYFYSKDPSAIYTSSVPCLSKPEAGQYSQPFPLTALCPFKRNGGGYPADLTYSHFQKLDTRAWCHPPRLAHATLAEVQAHPPHVILLSYIFLYSLSPHLFFFSQLKAQLSLRKGGEGGKTKLGQGVQSSNSTFSPAI